MNLKFVASLVACFVNLTVAQKIMTFRRVDDPDESLMDHETVVPKIVHQFERGTEGYPDEIQTRLEMTSGTFVLHLIMNRKLIPSHFVESHIKNGKMVFSKEHENCYYRGSVVGYPEWSAALSTCDGLSGVFGDFSDLKCLYHIEPVDSISDEIQQTHTVYRNGTCGYEDSHKHMVEPPHNFTTPHNRVRRQSATRVVELVIVSDFNQFAAHEHNLAKTKNRAKSIANFVNTLFSKINIGVELVGLQTWNSHNLISVSSNSQTLLRNFMAYRPSLLTPFPNHDTAMLLTGIRMRGGVLGVAGLGALCLRNSASVAQDVQSTLADIGATAAHELGHLFGMEHDNGRRCRCQGRNGRCIMAATTSNPPAAEWSSCSINDLNVNSARGVDRCLFNRPTVMFSHSPLSSLSSCGDGIREGEEECDCGAPENCDDSCCDPNTCKLVEGAVCSDQEPCCSNCQFRTLGAVCRESINECDIVEKCTGTSEECPSNRFLQDGTDCANGKAYCYDGMCQDLDVLCKEKFISANSTPPSVGPQECFNFNTHGNTSGNCGHNSTDFLPCDADNARCGLLQCQSNTSLLHHTGSDIVLSSQVTYVEGRAISCSSFTSQPGSDIIPGLVPNGAKCGDRKVCINLQCTAIGVLPCPSTNSQPCSGNGQCNDLNLCSCDDGYAGFDCSMELMNETRDETHSGHTNTQKVDGGDSCAIVNATIIVIAVTVVLVVVVVAACVVCRGKKKAAAFSRLPKPSWEDDVGFIAGSKIMEGSMERSSSGVATFHPPRTPVAYDPPLAASQSSERQSGSTSPHLYSTVQWSSVRTDRNTDVIYY